MNLPHRTFVVLGLTAVSLAGCARRVPKAPVPLVPPPAVAEEYRVQPGDLLDIKFLYHPNESQKLAVRPDGGLALGITGDLQVAGLTADELEDLVRTRASRYLRDPVVSITVAESGARAYVGGEVANAGFVSLTKPMSVLQAVYERGGFTLGADLSEVMVISRSSGDLLVRRLDVESAAKGAPLESPLLAPDDVVFVPKTGIAKANAWVDQWINGLTPDILKNIRVSPF
jgi:protein involved in polysaccharide export with SLBB domain